MTHTLVIHPDGSTTAIYDDALLSTFQALGDPVVSRASHVEPVPGGWQADMSPMNGPRLPITATRKQSLALERAWLEEKL